MLLEAIESLSRDEKEDKDTKALFGQIDQLFEQANVPQRRLMLSLTCSQAEKARWTGLLSPKQILSLISP